MKPFLPHMSHSKFPSGLQGKAIEKGIKLLIMDRRKLVLCIFQRPIKSVEGLMHLF